MDNGHDAPRYNAFLHELANIDSMIIVKEKNGIKYFTWITIDELKILLEI